MFGLTNASIVQKLEALEGVEACAGYVPLKERKKKSHIPQGDGEDDDDSFDFDSFEDSQMSQLSQALQTSEESQLEFSEEEELEKEALREVQALSARRRSRSSKTDKCRRQAASETVVKTLKRAMVGKDSCLRVRCRYCDGGLEAEDSLMWACVGWLRRSDNVIQVEYPASLFTGRKESVGVKKENGAVKKESGAVKKESGAVKRENGGVKRENGGASKKRRNHAEETLSSEAMFNIDMSGTYRTGFEAVSLGEGRVSVKPCASSLMKPKSELVLTKMK